MHQQHQTGVGGIEQPHFQVEGFPQQHLQGRVILGVVAAVLGVWSERRRVGIKIGIFGKLHSTHSELVLKQLSRKGFKHLLLKHWIGIILVISFHAS